MATNTFRKQLFLVWAFGIAFLMFLMGLHRPGGDGTGIYDKVFAPLPEGVSMRGVLGPYMVLDVLATLAAWLAPIAAIVLALRGRRLLKTETEEMWRDRLRVGTTAAWVILAVYLTPVGWTLLYGLTRWVIQDVWGEGPMY